MTTLRFIIPGKPSAWKRAGKAGRRHFTDSDMAEQQATIGWLCQQAMKEQGIARFSGPVELWIVACFACPRPWPKTKTRAATWYAKRPDRDNLEKQIGDALNSVAYDDDAQVVCGDVVKVQLPSGEAPFTLVTVHQADEESARSWAACALEQRRELEGATA